MLKKKIEEEGIIKISCDCQKVMIMEFKKLRETEHHVISPRPDEWVERERIHRHERISSKDSSKQIQ